MRDRFGIFGAVIRNRKLSLLLVMTLRMSNSRPSSGRERGRGNRRRPRPQLVHGMPPRPVEGRIPARQRLGCCRRVSALDADGWHEVLHQQETRPTITSVVPPGPTRGGQPTRLRPPRRIPVDLHGKCVNCLSSTHQVATYSCPSDACVAGAFVTSRVTASSQGT